jgi:hypothetical protein
MPRKKQANNTVHPKAGSFGRTNDRFGRRSRSLATTDTVSVGPCQTSVPPTNITSNVDLYGGLPERWVANGNPGVHTVRILQDAHGGHFVERCGGPPPSGWVSVIDPVTMIPYLVPPTNGYKEKHHMENHSNPARAKLPPNQNWFDQERYVTRALVRDLTLIPRFVINTPGFQFDSHAADPGWMLSCKQRHYKGLPGKLSIRLIHSDPSVRTTVMIRPSNHNSHAVVASEADFVQVFRHDFTVETEVIARQVHRPLAAYSDDELLAELRRRVDARLDGWKPRARVVDLSNVINLDQLRQEHTALDEDRLSRILAA